MFKVYQDKQPSFGLMPSRFPDNYELVATLDADFPLSACYQLTNSIDCNWFEDTGSGCHVVKPARSTSVGDIIVTPDGDMMLILPVGHRNIGKYVEGQSYLIPSGYGA